MEIRPISDIHLEFGNYKLPHLDTDKESILVLAGDICVATHTNYMTFRFKNFIEECCDRFAYVLMVMGNHEHYHGDFHKSYSIILRYTAHLENFKLLENDSIVIGDVCFIGSTLWTDCGDANSVHPMAAMHWSGMNDSQVISYMGQPNLSVYDVRDEFERSRAFILRQIRNAKELGRKACLITHHAPTMQSIDAAFAKSTLNKFFASDMVMDLAEAGVDLCIHGHMHQAKRFKLASAISEAEVICNPRGYHGFESKPEARGFNPNLVVEL